MTLLESLQKRSGSKCELCGSEDAMDICGICSTQLENSDLIDSNHWRCLNESMWSEVAGVQVLAWRMLQRLKNEGWPQDLLEMMYLDDDTLNWAKAMGDGVDA